VRRLLLVLFLQYVLEDLSSMKIWRVSGVSVIHILVSLAAALQVLFVSMPYHKYELWDWYVYVAVFVHWNKWEERLVVQC